MFVSITEVFICCLFMDRFSIIQVFNTIFVFVEKKSLANLKFQMFVFSKISAVKSKLNFNQLSFFLKKKNRSKIIN